MNIDHLLKGLNDLNLNPNAGSSSVGNHDLANLMGGMGALTVRDSSPPQPPPPPPRVKTQAEIERLNAKQRSRALLIPDRPCTPGVRGKFTPKPVARLNKLARDINKLNMRLTTTLRSINQKERNRQKTIRANKSRCHKINVTGRMCGGQVVTRNKGSSSANKARSVVTFCSKEKCANVKSENGVAVGGHQVTKKSGNGSCSNGNGNDVNLMMNNITGPSNWWP